MKTKIIAMSDTHGQHDKLTDLIWKEIKNVPEDTHILMVHCGDYDSETFHDWWSQFNVEKYFIEGNHDEEVEKEVATFVKTISGKNILLINKGHYNNIRPNNNHTYTDISKIVEETLQKYPSIKVDILVSHQPAFGILDEVINVLTITKVSVGDDDIKNVLEIVKPKIHLFGHIHDDAGKNNKYNETQFYNVSCLGGSHDKQAMYMLRENPLTIIEI